MDKFQVFGERVLILPDPAENVSKGGIVIPANAQARTCWGTVIAYGNNVNSLVAYRGRHVFYEKYAGTPVEIDGKEYLIVKEADVLGGLMDDQE